MSYSNKNITSGATRGGREQDVRAAAGRQVGVGAQVYQPVQESVRRQGVSTHFFFETRLSLVLNAVLSPVRGRSEKVPLSFIF